ncbi:dihydropteroate synthase [Sphingobium sp. SCG-1]|uniref:dihydropteroate synthase n=1 Tax=Sphingobium sp. SCG-1 TaxID=2072936 RepID=UPI001670C04A|nr:dihydropteroate synthase [Sphingobium sp. SCG-1]
MITDQIPDDARLTLRPVGFVDTPVGLDGRTARIGNSLLWFQSYEVVAIRRNMPPLRRQLSVEEFAGWVSQQSEPLSERLARLAANIAAPRQPLQLGARTIRLDTPQVMGILNLTPDSFSDGGKHVGDAAAAADAGFAMTAAGAALVDVGGESTRPGAERLWEGDEIARVVPVIERLAASGVPVSVDTRKAAVMEAALAAGASVVNDISALLHDPRSMDVVAKAGCPVILMHAPSTGDDPHENRGGYTDVATDVFEWLEARIAACEAGGIARDKIIVDPGLGFGKSLTDNLTLINRLALFSALGVPLLFGGSRKRMIGALSNEAPASDRLGGSITLAVKAAELGAQMVRVHDVPETVQALHIWRGLRDTALAAAG